MGSRDNYVLGLSAGKAYINGFETETLSNIRTVLPKARTASHVKLKEINTRPTYEFFFGSFILPPFVQHTMYLTSCGKSIVSPLRPLSQVFSECLPFCLFK